MPEMSGLQLQEEMKKREIDLPIIFLTGHGDIDMAVKALLTGATDFIVKPPEPNRLKEALAKAVAKIRTIEKPQKPAKKCALSSIC